MKNSKLLVAFIVVVITAFGVFYYQRGANEYQIKLLDEALLTTNFNSITVSNKGVVNHLVKNEDGFWVDSGNNFLASTTGIYDLTNSIANSKVLRNAHLTDDKLPGLGLVEDSTKDSVVVSYFIDGVLAKKYIFGIENEKSAVSGSFVNNGTIVYLVNSRPKVPEKNVWTTSQIVNWPADQIKSIIVSNAKKTVYTKNDAKAWLVNDASADAAQSLTINDLEGSLAPLKIEQFKAGALKAGSLNISFIKDDGAQLALNLQRETANNPVFVENAYVMTAKLSNPISAEDKAIASYLSDKVFQINDNLAVKLGL